MWHAWAEPNEEDRTNLLTPLTMLALVSFTSPMENQVFWFECGFVENKKSTNNRWIMRWL
jgi:hypothetical protein